MCKGTASLSGLYMYSRCRKQILLSVWAQSQDQNVSGLDSNLVI